MSIFGRLKPHKPARLGQCLQQYWPKSFQVRCVSTTCSPGMGVPRAKGEYAPTENELVQIVRSRRGPDILHNPWANKGTAFPASERERLGIRGLLPTKETTMDLQSKRFMDDYLYGRTYIDPEHIQDGGVTPEHVRRWRLLQELQDRNETLFYKVLLENFVEMTPIIYTPTVGWACLNYARLYRRPRGMYFSATDKGEMSAIAWNWPCDHVDAIVVTDGSRILGLGDLGINGLGISVGKLDCYVAAAGFNPRRVLPVVIDVGTDNEALRNDPLYMGLKQPRVGDEEYFEVLDEFVAAMMARWPHAVLQFEDFNLAHAHPLLNRYRDHHCIFNDDIQGTAATAVSGIYGALAVQGKPVKAITEQKFVVVGAGSAGMGVVGMTALGMMKHGLTEAQAADHFWILDASGLITKARQGLTAVVEPFARLGEADGESLIDVVKRVKPTALIGLSGAGPIFTKEVLEAMGQFNEHPIIFPMSNPTHRMECRATDAQKCTGGRAIFASGSPQADVVMGLAFGAHLARSGRVSDLMIMAAAETLPHMIPEEDKAVGCVYPRLSNIRNISIRVTRDVIKAAHSEGLVKNSKALAALKEGDEALSSWIHCMMYKPKYNNLIHLPVGVRE